MPSNEFIPELHDIGKLVDKKKIQSENSKLVWDGHVFYNFDFSNIGISKPISPSWWGQYHHFKIDNIKLPDWENEIDPKYRYNLFLLKLSDHLASSTSRATIEKGKKEASNNVYKLWNTNQNIKYEFPFNSFESLKNLFEEVNNCTSSKDFLNKYNESLKLIPEDKSAPINITSLSTHLNLVGKIYRILEKNTEFGNDKIIYNDIEGQVIRDIEGSRKTDDENNKEKGLWQARFLKCKVKYNHSFVRLQDVNLINKRNSIINDMLQRNPDEILFYSDDFLVLFLPLGHQEGLIFKELTNENFFIEIDETVADLGILSTILDNKVNNARQDTSSIRYEVLKSRDTKVFKKYLYGDTSHLKIYQLCEICQSQNAKPVKKDNVTDWICDKCFNVRKMGVPFIEYATTWERESVDVCWFKIEINQTKLIEWLKSSFTDYIKFLDIKGEINGRKISDVLIDEFRPLAVQIDFNNEFDNLVSELKQELGINSDFTWPINHYKLTGVFKYSYENFSNVIDQYIKLHDKFFPDCVSDINSPISLSLSIANIKYPLREHFRYFDSEVKNFLNISKTNVFDENYSKDNIKIIKRICENKGSSSFLHKLTQLSVKFSSDIHLSVEVFNNRSKNQELFELIAKGVKPNKILNIFKLYKEGSNG